MLRRKAKLCGFEKGKNEKQKEIALKLLKLNIPNEQISEATGLSLEEIKKLKPEQKK